MFIIYCTLVLLVLQLFGCGVTTSYINGSVIKRRCLCSEGQLDGGTSLETLSGDFVRRLCLETLSRDFVRRLCLDRSYLQ